MSDIKIHVFHTGEVCVAPDLPFCGEYCNAVKVKNDEGKFVLRFSDGWALAGVIASLIFGIVLIGSTALQLIVDMTIVYLAAYSAYSIRQD